MFMIFIYMSFAPMDTSLYVFFDNDTDVARYFRMAREFTVLFLHII